MTNSEPKISPQKPWQHQDPVQDSYGQDNNAINNDRQNNHNQKIEAVFAKFFDKLESIKPDIDLKTYNTIVERLEHQKQKLFRNLNENQDTSGQTPPKQPQFHHFFEKKLLKPRQIIAV